MLLFHYVLDVEIANIRENGFTAIQQTKKFEDGREETYPGVGLTSYPYIKGQKGYQFEAAFALEIPESIVKPFQMKVSPSGWRKGYKWFWVPTDLANQFFAFRINLHLHEPEILYAWIKRCIRCDHMACLHPSPQGWQGPCLEDACQCLKFALCD